MGTPKGVSEALFAADQSVNAWPPLTAGTLAIGASRWQNHLAWDRKSGWAHNKAGRLRPLFGCLQREKKSFLGGEGSRNIPISEIQKIARMELGVPQQPG